MIESLKSAAAINATLFAMQGVQPGRDQGQADAAPLRQPEPQMSEAATLSAAIQRLISERVSKPCASSGDRLLRHETCYGSGGD